MNQPMTVQFRRGPLDGDWRAYPKHSRYIDIEIMVGYQQRATLTYEDTDYVTRAADDTMAHVFVLSPESASLWDEIVQRDRTAARTSHG